MPFQTSVKRQYTKGFVGEVVRFGTLRAKPGRLASESLSNEIGLVYGLAPNSATYAQQTGAPGLPEADKVVNTDRPASNTSPAVYATGLCGEVYEVIAGGDVFFGILSHPKHYALQGTPEGALSPTYQLPANTEGEFIDMTAGLVVKVYNNTTSDVELDYGTELMYATKSDVTVGIPAGGIVPLPKSGTLPDGYKLLPKSFVIDPVNLPKPTGSGDDVVASTVTTVIQMAN